MADHDALLGISRLIRQRAPTESHLLHNDHDRVWQLILHTLQGDFAGISAPTSVSSSSSAISPWSAASLLWPQIKTPWASSRSCATRGGCLAIYKSLGATGSPTPMSPTATKFRRWLRLAHHHVPR